MLRKDLKNEIEKITGAACTFKGTNAQILRDFDETATEQNKWELEIRELTEEVRKITEEEKNLIKYAHGVLQDENLEVTNLLRKREWSDIEEDLEWLQEAILLRNDKFQVKYEMYYKRFRLSTSQVECIVDGLYVSEMQQLQAFLVKLNLICEYLEVNPFQEDWKSIYLT